MRSRLSTIGLAMALACCKGGLSDSTPAPVPPRAQTQPVAGVVAQVDSALRARWAAGAITPAARVDDAGFLRRVHLDVIGALPSPEAVRAFLADTAPDKRARAVEALLADPRYADRWTDYWDRVLLGPEAKNKLVDRQEFRRFLHAAFARNASWNEMATALITAEGTNTPATADDDAEDVNGAVNWLLRYGRAPQDLSGQASRVLLGVQIQCAQCHDHKSEKWTQEDFQRFTAFFANTRPQPLDDAKGVRRVRVTEGDRPLPALKKNPELRPILGMAPRALDGTELAEPGDRRKQLAAWMTSGDNPWFSRAIVNRMWALFLGRGLVNPVDDLRPSNPAAVPEVLDRLAEDFEAHGHDLKHLIRVLCTTEAYQLAARRPAKGADSDGALWSFHPVEPLAPEVLIDAIVSAAGVQPLLERVAGGNIEQLRAQMRRHYSFVFDVDEERSEDEFEGTIPQALLLLNGVLVGGGSSLTPGAALAEVMSLPGDAARIEALYLRTLSRPPTAAETERWTRFVSEPHEPASAAPPAAKADTNRGRDRKRRGVPNDPLARFAGRVPSSARTAREQAYEDMFWALLNSSEFVFNH